MLFISAENLEKFREVLSEVMDRYPGMSEPVSSRPGWFRFSSEFHEKMVGHALEDSNVEFEGPFRSL